MDLREVDLSRALAERNSGSVRIQKSRSSFASAGRNAVELVAQSVDPQTGQVQTFRIALWVADACARDIGTAVQAYAALESHLLARGTGELDRFNQDLVQAMQTEAASGRRRYLVCNPILAQAWDPSGACNEPASGLRALLERHGLALPAVSVAAGVPRVEAAPIERQES